MNSLLENSTVVIPRGALQESTQNPRGRQCVTRGGDDWKAEATGLTDPTVLHGPVPELGPRSVKAC